MRGALLYRVAGRISLHTREQESFLPLESHYFLAIKKRYPRLIPHDIRVYVSFNSRVCLHLGGHLRDSAPHPRRFLVIW